MDSPAPVNRRTALKRAGALAVALGALEAVGPFSFVPARAGASIVPSDIQFDVSAFLAVPPQNYGSDVQFQMPPVHTVFLTAALERTPTRADQAEMNRALGVLEQHYPWSARHLVTFVAYGLPYFDRLPGGRAGRLVARYMPRLASDASRYVLEEAQPGPTDVSPANPGITKLRYNVNVRIERNEHESPGQDGIYTERVQYMFHAPSIAAGNKNPYTGGGGPALLPNENRGPHYAERTAQGIGTAGGERRMGHLSCLQRTSRAADGTPLHIRMDGPGFDAMDVPGGGNLPKLQFTIFAPSAEFFRTLRTSQASLDLQDKYGVSVEDNGLERFLTATRRQNFLVPPRRHRAFPLTELA